MEFKNQFIIAIKIQEFDPTFTEIEDVYGESLKFKNEQIEKKKQNVKT